MKRILTLLMVPVVIILAVGTIIEKYHGNAFAVDHVYNSWWFILLLAAVGVACIVTIVRNKLWHTPPQLLLWGHPTTSAPWTTATPSTSPST